MSEKQYLVPNGMLKTACAEFCKWQGHPGYESYAEGHVEATVRAALQWLDEEILHERNVDFHRAILEAEKKRCPGNDQYGSVIARRVDFEYGVSFARNYIRNMFLASEPPIDPLVMYIMRHFDDVEVDEQTRRNRAEAAVHDYQEHLKRNTK